MEIGVLSRKRKSLDAATEVFTVVPERAREAVRQRFQSELVTVRRLLKKARSEVPPAKRSKQASPPSVTVTKVPKKMTQGERELVGEDLAGLAAKLPDHIVQLLEKQCCAISDGEMEIDIHALQDESVVELQQKLDEFVQKRANPSVEERASSKMTAGEEEEEDVDICGGVSPLAIVQAPLQLAEEEDEDVDICGDASPVVMPKKLGDDAIIGSPSSSSSNSDSDTESDSSSSESDSDTSSDGSTSDSESDEDESVDSPAPAERAATPPRTKLVVCAKESLERQRKEARFKAREKARQEVLETERTAIPDETIHPMDLESLGIADRYNMWSRHYLLRRLGLFLKADNYCVEAQRQHRRQIFQEDLEEGEIRV